MPSPGRLTSTADFRRAYALGRRSTSRVVVVHGWDRRDLEPARVGITAARAVGGSVQRNRAKRRVREAVRPIRPVLCRGVDVVFVATARAASVNFQELVSSVREGASAVGALDA